ncbi:MAG TPA: ThiF family adenylyltransferase [Ignavibacteria bacterium]
MAEALDILTFIRDSTDKAISEISKIYEVNLIENGSKYDIKVDIKIKGKIEEFKFIIIFHEFPLQIPIILISPEDIYRIKGIPHIGLNGFICTYDQNVRTNMDNPTAVLVNCIEKAKLIIKNGLEGKNREDIEEEFINYWNGGDFIFIPTISTIDYTVDNPSNLNFYFLKKSFNKFLALVTSDDEKSSHFTDFLNTNNILIKTPSFYVGNLPSTECLSVKSYRQSLELIKKYKKDIMGELENFINSNDKLVILFKNKIKNNNYYFGWAYTYYSMKNGFNPTKTSNFDILTSIIYQGLQKVVRLNTEVFTKERSHRRSSGLNFKQNKQINLSIVGLGSIGSNIIPFLKPLNIDELLLIDKESLLIENIGRHFLGLDYLNDNKANAMKIYLKRINPYLKISVEEKSLVEIITNNPQKLNKSDFIIICIGDTNSEIFADIALKSKVLKKPLIFIWVEPYLAGGHLVYMTPTSKTNFKNLFEDNYYINNIINKEEYKKNRFTDREAGCQTSFTPYSLINIMSFLSDLYPRLLEILNRNIKSGKSLIWIGDTKFIKDNGIRLSKIAEENKMGNIIEKDII